MLGRYVILDANLLVLLIVGSASRSYIEKHKRLRAYAESDFDQLLDMLSSTHKIIVTPNTVTETSNLVGQIAEPARAHIFAVFRQLLDATDEIYIASTQAAGHDAFPRLGVTDSGLLNVASEGHTLLTSDLDLYLEASRLGHATVNFIHYIAANR